MSSLRPICQREPGSRRSDLIAAGAIGQPLLRPEFGARTVPRRAGNWPLDPTWFYQNRSGPLFDMGVYGIHDITGIR